MIDEIFSHLTPSSEAISPEEARLLAPYFSNADRSVVALTNLPEVVKGALFSRYSRTSKGVRRLFLDEFFSRPELELGAEGRPLSAGIREEAGGGGRGGAVEREAAEAFYGRVLSDYGDDSVGELGGAHIAFQEISQIAAKAIEDHRIGLSFLEKSSRYVPFDDRVNGQFRYYRDRTLLGSRFNASVVSTLDGLFEAYAAMLPKMIAHLERTYPIADVEFENALTGEVMRFARIADEEFAKSASFAYRQAVRAQACDLLRCFLPMATLTNVGVWGNGRALEYMLLTLLADPLEENLWLGRAGQHELQQVIGPFIKRADDEKGKRQQEYIRARRAAQKRLADQYLEPTVGAAPQPSSQRQGKAALVHYDADAVEQVAAAILFPASTDPKTSVLRAASQLSADEIAEIVRGYIGTRGNRRHKPGRAFEHARYEFELLINVGEFRDLQRHRVVTPDRQAFTTAHGYETNEAIMAVPEIRAAYDANMEQAEGLYRALTEDFPSEAQYVVPFGFRVRYNVELNLRELYHWVELRTTEQGHPDYRLTSQQMYEAVRQIHPLLVEGMKFANLNPNVPMSRLRAEMRRARKRVASAEGNG
jgi:thymidylate synthase ThyX